MVPYSKSLPLENTPSANVIPGSLGADRWVGTKNVRDPVQQQPQGFLGGPPGFGRPEWSLRPEGPGRFAPAPEAGGEGPE